MPISAGISIPGLTRRTSHRTEVCVQLRWTLTPFTLANEPPVPPNLFLTDLESIPRTEVPGRDLLTLQNWHLSPHLHLERLGINGASGREFIYFSFAIKKAGFDFADELKVGYVRYKHLTQITIKVQLF